MKDPNSSLPLTAPLLLTDLFPMPSKGVLLFANGELTAAGRHWLEKESHRGGKAVAAFPSPPPRQTR
jgi:hypothetical protein